MDNDEQTEVMEYVCSNPHCEKKVFYKDVYICEACGNPFCESCAEIILKVCANCRLRLCENCIKRDPETHELFCCDECKQERKEIEE